MELSWDTWNIHSCLFCISVLQHLSSPACISHHRCVSLLPLPSSQLYWGGMFCFLAFGVWLCPPLHLGISHGDAGEPCGMLGFELGSAVCMTKQTPCLLGCHFGPCTYDFNLCFCSDYWMILLHGWRANPGSISHMPDWCYNHWVLPLTLYQYIM